MYDAIKAVVHNEAFACPFQMRHRLMSQALSSQGLSGLLSSQASTTK